MRLCAFHFSSFSICIVHQQLRWRRCRCGLHWVHYVCNVCPSGFAVVHQAVPARRAQGTGHRALGTGHSGWNHVFAEMHFHAPHISRASPVCTSCMLHAGSSPALPVHRHQSCPLVTGSQFQFHWHSRSQVMAYVSCAVQCTFI